MRRIRSASGLALVIVLSGCSPADDKAAGRSELIGSYSLVVPAGQASARKDFASSTLRLTKDGMFTQQCRYKSGKADSAIGTWSYSNRHAQFSVFKDCAGVLQPSAANKGSMGRRLQVELGAPTRIVLSSQVNVRYERHGPQ
jgi:hypothetical protein